MVNGQKSSEQSLALQSMKIPPDCLVRGPNTRERTDSFSAAPFLAAAALKAAPETFHPILICMAGESRGQRFRLQRRDTIIGRSRSCEIYLTDGGTSRQHSRITWENWDRSRENPVCYVEDMGSRNGTELNGVLIRGRVQLTERDRITIGRTILGFYLRDTEELLQDESLYVNATRDALTGLDNRYQMLSHLKHYMALASRRTLDLGLLLIDVDHFKNINDRFGHPIGDEALQHLAGILSRCSRESDLVARWGGEEFAVSTPDTTLATAIRYAERLRQTVQDTPLVTGDQEIKMTISVGVAMLGEMDTLHSFFEKADKALYEAKQSGRNRVISAAIPPASDVPDVPTGESDGA
ncbi:diguanylate cyclase [bacterium]|nr:diguanylate cyclase [bacterium]